jgi:hypothetical protein
VTKSAKSAWSSLLVELAPVLAAFLLPVLLKRLIPAPAPEAKSSIWWIVLLSLAGYAVFIGLTVFLVKFGWRHL